MEEEVALRRLEVMAAGIGYCPLLDRRPELSERRMLWEWALTETVTDLHLLCNVERLV
jgi:hypothetical protein